MGRLSAQVPWTPLPSRLGSHAARGVIRAALNARTIGLPSARRTHDCALPFLWPLALAALEDEAHAGLHGCILVGLGGARLSAGDHLAAGGRRGTGGRLTCGAHRAERDRRAGGGRLASGVCRVGAGGRQSCQSPKRSRQRTTL